MLQRFISFVEREHLFAQGQRVLLAVSGGRDSSVLCHLMHCAGYSFAIAHCNFNLRPGDCDRDEAFVRRLAEGYGVPVHVARFDTRTYAAERSLSIEEAARRLRYNYFDELMDTEGYAATATAHHRDDSIETFFINLLRGTGIAGLHGIPVRNGRVVRPLLGFGRGDIDDYVEENKLSYVEDCTNAELVYQRNRIRHQLIPLLRMLSPSFDATMKENIRRLSETEQVYRAMIEGVRARIVEPTRDGGCRMSLGELRGLRPLRTYLFELLQPYGFTPALCDAVAEALDKQSGKSFFSATHTLVKDREYLIVQPRDVEMRCLFLVEQSDVDGDGYGCDDSLPLTFDVVPMDGKMDLRVPAAEALFDYDAISFPLMLRHWQEGDRFRPFGMQGTRLVSDLFSDLKVSLLDKQRVWLLCDRGGTILWVCGLRAADQARVTAATRRVLRCRMKER